MTTPAPPGVVRPPWADAFGTDFQRRILTTIVEGAPFSRSCSPLPTQRGSVAFGILDANDPAWVAELGEIPDLAKDQSSYEVAVSKLAGSILVSQESIDDSDFPLTTSVEQVLRDTFSNKLDRDLIGGAGPLPVPTGILSVAAEVPGADWELAAVAAKAAIATAGGTASHIAVSPAVLGEIEAARDDLGRALYPDAATTFAGLATVSAVAATQPVVFDRARCWLVVRRDFSAETSRETSSAWEHYATSLRVVGRFALAVPQPSKACRKLAVAGGARAARPAGKAG
jgi:HK97 family phage major capsid protein